MPKKLPAYLKAAVGRDLDDKAVAQYKEPLFIQGAEGLAELSRFQNIEAIEILGSDVPSLEEVAKLPKLKLLRVIGCTLSDLSALAEAEQLVELELSFNCIEDLSPLLRVKSLHWLRLFGNPLSPKSYDEVLPKLRKKLVPGQKRPIVLEVSPREEWQIARTIWDQKLRVTYGRFPRTAESTLVTPGIGSKDRPIKFVKFSENDLKEMIEEPGFAQYGIFHDPPAQEHVDQDPSRFRVRWLSGNNRDAYNWVAANLAEGPERENYMSFIGEFSDEMFFVEHPTLIEAMEEKHQVTFPAWWKQARTKVLAGVRPHLATVQLRFEKFAKAAITRNGGLYKIGYLGYYNKEDRKLFFDKCGMFPIGDIARPRDLGNSLLAINLKQPNDRRVYELWPQSVYDAASEKPLKLITPVFADWPELLAHVTEILPKLSA